MNAFREGSIPSPSTLESWQSLANCSSLLNCGRRESAHGFESLALRLGR